MPWCVVEPKGFNLHGGYKEQTSVLNVHLQRTRRLCVQHLSEGERKRKGGGGGLRRIDR